MTLHEAIKAANTLKETGITVRVIDAFTVKPIDRETILKSANTIHGRLLVVEDHYYEGGLGEAVIAHLAVPEVARSGKAAELLNKYGIDAQHIAEAVKKFLPD